MAKIMAVNAGSSSIKFQWLEMPAEVVIASGVMEKIGTKIDGKNRISRRYFYNQIWW